jgi:hypothetical protein
MGQNSVLGAVLPPALICHRHGIFPPKSALTAALPPRVNLRALAWGRGRKQTKTAENITVKIEYFISFLVKICEILVRIMVFSLLNWVLVAVSHYKKLIMNVFPLSAKAI